MHNPRTSLIKREQRKSFLLRQLSTMLHTLCEDEPKLIPLFVSKVDLSDDGGICYVYMSATPLSDQSLSSKELFEELLPMLVLYKPSMRKSLAGILQKRYVPDIKFLFDENREKVDKINALLDRAQQELEEIDKVHDSAQEK